MLVASCIALLTSCFGAISNWLDSIGMGVGIAVRTLMMGQKVNLALMVLMVLMEPMAAHQSKGKITLLLLIKMK